MDTGATDEGSPSAKERFRFLNFKKSNYWKELCFSVLPKCLRKLCRCKRSREDKILKIGRKKMEREVNIVEIIKSRRYFKAALQRLLT